MKIVKKTKVGGQFTKRVMSKRSYDLENDLDEIVLAFKGHDSRVNIARIVEANKKRLIDLGLPSSFNVHYSQAGGEVKVLEQQTSSSNINNGAARLDYYFRKVIGYDIHDPITLSGRLIVEGTLLLENEREKQENIEAAIRFGWVLALQEVYESVGRRNKAGGKRNSTRKKTRFHLLKSLLDKFNTTFPTKIWEKLPQGESEKLTVKISDYKFDYYVDVNSESLKYQVDNGAVLSITFGTFKKNLAELLSA
jgi:hypothetical protein